jgi:hypothetical protein
LDCVNTPLQKRPQSHFSVNKAFAEKWIAQFSGLDVAKWLHAALETMDEAISIGRKMFCVASQRNKPFFIEFNCFG